MGWNGVFGNPCLWTFLVAEAWRSPIQPNIHLLPEALQATVFDMQVNAGGNAIKILQRLLGQFKAPVSVDGALGPYTAAAVHRVYDEAGGYLVDAAQPHGNTPEPAEAGRGVGSNELRNLFNQSIT